MSEPADELVCLGAVATAHGVRGLVKLKSFTEQPEDMAAYGPLTDAAGVRVFRLALKGKAGGLLLAAIEGVTTREQAEALRGQQLFAPRSALPPPDEGFYWSDLEGLAAVEASGETLGRVEAVLDYGAGPVLQIRLQGGGELLLPFAAQFVPAVDIAGGRLTIVPPVEVVVPPQPGGDARAEEAGAGRRGGGDMSAPLPAAWQATPAGKPRARALGLPFAGTPGPLNAITDVAGLEVGYCTLIEGEGPLAVGRGPVRTGVTAILPRGRGGAGRPVWAGAHSLNGNGEMTGAWWLEETGRCELAITITNTHSCGLTRDATLQWAVRQGLAEQGQQDWGLPVAAETYDGWLNDINGFHIRPEHVFQALDGARGGALEEGSVGGGTGMICYGFKGGSGSASRQITAAGRPWTLGAFVQANFGRSEELSFAGLRVGPALAAAAAGAPFPTGGGGSIIVVLATDAPLLPHQLKRLARRAALGVGRSGTIGHHSSGDIFLALTTANAAALLPATAPIAIETLPEDSLDPLFGAAVEATDEAIWNALAANATMVGRDGHRVPALPHDALRRLLAATAAAGAGQAQAKAP